MNRVSMRKLIQSVYAAAQSGVPISDLYGLADVLETNVGERPNLSGF
ncbi:MAG: hypothetical protein ACP5NX_00690 [Candidatus Bilamarchaeaceae archaeon]